ncbi:MAG: hypothetical protein AAF514_19565 [Verrucomicrobiota bacterium]
MSLASAGTFVIPSATDILEPSTRGSAFASHVGWDSFDDDGAGDMIINDFTPDIGFGVGALLTLNGEDHISGSGNYYSGGGSVSEQVAFDTNGVAGSGFTSVIAQGITLFGPFGSQLSFSEINGVSPDVIQLTNAAGKGQFWAKWDLPGNESSYQFEISGGSSTSFDKLVVDSSWSSSGFSSDLAIPEPSAALFVLLGFSVFCGLTRHRRSK